MVSDTDSAGRIERCHTQDFIQRDTTVHHS
jgi:hypothetical protein